MKLNSYFGVDEGDTSYLVDKGDEAYANQLKLFELLENGKDYIVIKAPDDMSQSMSVTLPSEAGSSDYVLTWQDGNIMQWKDVSSISGIPELIQVVTDFQKSGLTSVGCVSGNCSYDGILENIGESYPLDLENGGLGSDLSSPSEDKILFYDESEGRVRWLTVGDNLEIDGTDLDAESGGVFGDTSPSGEVYTGEIYTAGNGLSVSGSEVQFGGTLERNTTITQSNYNLVYNLTGTGDFDVQDSGVSVLKIDDSGAVSIGVSDPTSALDIKGSTQDFSSLRIRSGVTPLTPYSGDIYSDGTNIYFWNGSSWDDLTEVGSTGDILPTGFEGQFLYNNDGTWEAFNGLFWDDGSSYLGLGTTNPQYTLDVNGTARFDSLRTGEIYLSGTQITADAEELNILDGALVSTSELNVLSGVNPTLTSSELNILDGALVSTSELNLLVGRSGTLIDTNNISSYAITPAIIGNYAVTSITAGSGLSQTSSGPGQVTLDIGAGDGIYLDVDSLSLQIATSGSFTSNSSFSGLELNSSGLSLLGGCFDDQVLAWDTDTQSWMCSSKLALGGITGSGSGVSTEGQVAIWNGSSTITGSDGLWFESSSGRLGIGTTSPDYDLHVVGSVAASDYFSSFGNVGATSNVSGMVFENGLYISGTIAGFLTPSDIGAVGGVQEYNSETSLLGQTIELSSSEVTGILPVSFGGTGTDSFTENALLLGSGTGPLGVVSVGQDGQILLGVTGSGPIFSTLTGDASVTNTGVLTLSSTSVVSGTYGDTYLIPQITVDEKGRLTQVTEIDIQSSLLPEGLEGQMIYNNSGTWVAFDSMYWDDGSLSLGIGTTDPQSTLDVNGDITSTSIFTQTLYLSGTQVEALASELNVLNGILASTSELNLLAGATISTSELNVLTGILASTSELNVLNGILVSTSELNILNGILASTSELNLLAGRTGELVDTNNIGTYAVTPSNASGYVITSITAGSGLSISSTGPGAVTLDVGAGDGISVLDDTITLSLVTSGSSSSRSSVSGLELSSQGLSLIQGCTDDEVLSWDDVNGWWECSSKLGGGAVAVEGSPLDNQLAVWSGGGTSIKDSNLWFVSDNLGIGTSAPEYNLHVAGSLMALDFVSGEGNLGASTTVSGLTFEDGLYVSGTISGFLTPLDIGIVGGVQGYDANTTILGQTIELGSSEVTGTLNVSNGGTGTTSLTNYGLVVGSGTNPLRTISLGTDGQILLGVSGSDPSFGTLTGDAAISNTGVLTLSSTSVASGTYGTSILIPQITVDEKGRLTSASNVDISSYLLPVGAEGQMIYNNSGTWVAFDSMYWDDGSLSLGIGTTNPQSTLDVNGDISSTSIFTQTLYLSGSEVTALASELNVLDGILASTSELNVLNGILASTSELNVLNGILASTSELNLLAGRTGTLLDSSNIGTYAVTPSNASSYVITSITAGSGLSISSTGPGDVTLDIGAGDGISVLDDTITLSLSSSGTGVSTASASGLELTSNGLRLLGGCSDNQVLAWDLSAEQWQCMAPTSIGIVSGSGVEGQISFFTGANTQSGSSNLFWDIANSRLGIGLTNPQYDLDVLGAIQGSSILTTNFFISGTQVTSSAVELNLLDGISGSLISTGNISSNAITSLTAGTGISLSGTGPGNVTVSLDNSGVTAGTYGSENIIPTFSVDSKGRIIAASSVAVVESDPVWVAASSSYFNLSASNPTVLGIPSFNGGTSGSTPPFYVDSKYLVTNLNAEFLGGYGANNLPYVQSVVSGSGISVITSGTAAYISTVSLTDSGVTPGTYGSESLIPIITVDSKGRITSASNAVSLGDISQVTAGSGLSGGGTSGDVTLNIGQGDGISVLDDSITLNLVSSTAVGGSSSSVSGLELSTSGLTLLRGCGNDQVLSWNATTKTWVCSTKLGGGAVSGSGTTGQIAYFNGSGSIAGNNSFWYSESLSRMGIGTSDPEYDLHVAGTLMALDYVSGEGNLGASTTVSGLTFEDGLYVSGTISGFLTPLDIGIVGGVQGYDANTTILGSSIDLPSEVTGILTVPYGGTGLSTLSDHGVLVGSGTGAITSLSVGTDGQILIGQTGDDPVFQTLSGDIGSVSTSGSVSLATISGLVSGTYGTSTDIPVFQVDSKGRVIVAGTIPGGFLTSESYLGTVTSITSGSGMNFSTITSTGSITLGTPSAISSSSTNGLTATSHTHELTGEDARIWGTTLTDGSGTTGRLSLWLDSSTVGDSLFVGSGTALYPNVSDYDLGTSTYRWDLFANTINADSTVTFSSLSSGGLLKSTSGTGQLTLATAGVDYLVTEVGDISAVGSMTTGDVFAGADASGDWLGLGSSAGRIQFYDLATDSIALMNAYVGIGISSPTHALELATHTTASGGISFGSDVEIYRSAANTLSLASGDSFTVVGGAFTTSGGAVNINASSNYATNVNTGTSTGAVSIGGGSNTVAVNTTSWDISSAGVASGFTGITSSGNIVFSSLSSGGLVKAASGTGQLSLAVAGTDYLVTEVGDISSVIAGSGLIDGGTAGDVTLNIGDGSGIEINADSIDWGGALSENTTITLGAYDVSFNINSTGTVGIGTTNPTQALDVVGNLQLSGAFMPGGDAGTSGYYLQSQGSGSAPVWVDLSTTLLPVGTQGQMLYNASGVWTPFDGLFWDDSSLSLGIGTTSPNAKIDIVGTGTGASTSSLLIADAMGRSLFNVRDSGNIGIGTTNPLYKLDIYQEGLLEWVIGEPIYSGFGVLDDMSTGGTFTGSEETTYQVYIDSVGTPDTFEWTDDGGITSTTAVAITGGTQPLSNGVIVSFSNTTGHVIYDDRWYFTVTSQSNDTVNLFGIRDWKGEYSLAIDSNGNFNIQNTGVSSFYVSGSSGNVGIGTTSPEERVTLAGGNFRHYAEGDPVLKGLYDDLEVTDVYVSGNYAYITGWDPDSDDWGLQIIDVSNPSSPSLVGFYSGVSGKVLVVGNYAYVEGGSGLNIIDISNPTSPTLIGTYDTNSLLDFDISGKYAYITRGTDGISIVDISDPVSPLLVGTYDEANRTEATIKVSGKFAYLGSYISSNQYSYFRIFDISNPTSPLLVGNLFIGGSWALHIEDIDISGKYAYLATAYSNLVIVDISNPSSPLKVGSVEAGRYQRGVQVSGNYAYIASIAGEDGGGFLHVIDISNPTGPTKVGSYYADDYFSGAARGVFVSGKYAYLAEDRTGLLIIDINGIETPTLNAGNIWTSDLSVVKNADIGNNLNIRNALNIGPGGLYTQGPASIMLGAGITNPQTALSVYQLSSGDILNLFNNTGEVLTLTNGGYLGLGTTNPLYQLDVFSSTSDPVARFLSSDDLAQILLSDNDTTGYLNIKDSIFSIGLTSGLSANNLNINSSGNIGIGTTTPGLYKLNVAGSFIATDYFSGDGTLGAEYSQDGLVFKDGLYTAGTFPVDTNTTYTAANGLTLSGTEIQLGGTLLKSTSIVQGNYNMVYNLTGTGNFDIQNTGVSSLYISGSSGNVGIGTTAPDYDLDVLGTIQGYNFLTSGGMPVNDILLEEEVRNLSITAMTGSLGLDMTSNFVEKISKTNFYADSLWESSALTTLTNGNVLIAFHGAAGGGEALFAIYDSVGGLVTSGNLNQGDSASGLSTTSLTNGNVLIAYRDDTNSGYGTFVIYDSAGNLVKSETVFNSGDTSYSSKISATTLTNGNVLIAYRDDTNSGYGTFVIYDSAGNLVKSETVFNSGNTSEFSTISATALTNGNVLISYRDDSNNDYGTFVIYDSAGDIVKSETVFHSTAVSDYCPISSSTLTNGNILIAYTDGNNSFYGTFVIYDSVGNQVKSPTVFESAPTTSISTTALTNGNTLIAYTDGGNSDYGTFVIYDAKGNMIQSETVFDDENMVNYISATTLTNGNVLISFESWNGYLVIWGSSGASFANLVGIGTTNPGEQLDVVGGNIRTDSKLIAGGAVLGYGEGTGVTDRVGGSAKFMTGTGYIYFDRNNSDITMDETTGDLSGHAFSDDLGWIDFGEVENPSGPVNVNLTSGSVTGKAYVISSGSYVDFTNYSSNVSVNLSTGVFTGYVWAEEAGWIDFSDAGVYFSNNTITTFAADQNLYINPKGDGVTFMSGNVTIDGTVFANAFSSNSPLRLQTAGIDRIYVDDALGYVGIGTTDPGYMLDVVGTIRAQNFVTTGGMPVNDILLEQEVRNLSITAMTGSLGLDMTSNFVVKEAETTFNAGTTFDPSATTLTNGNILIAYRDQSSSGYGNFVIYDSLGNLVVSETTFNAGYTDHTSATTLTNGNVLIAYSDSVSGGTFVIYDSAGNLVKSETTFNNSGETRGVSATTLTNGNILIAYIEEGSSYYGNFVIYDSSGNLIKSETTFNAGYTDHTSATTLTNGNVLIAYSDSVSGGTFVIYDSSGNQIKSATVFDSDNTESVSTITLTNGNFLISYLDASSSFSSRFVIYDSSGNLIKSETPVGVNSAGLSATNLTNGNILFTYYDWGSTNYGNFVIYDSAGNLVVSETTFNASATYEPSATTLTNGNVLIAYSETASYYGRFVIYASSGASFANMVGIGTTNPTSKLEIIGTGTGADTSSLWIKNAIGDTGLFVNDLGYVGIGTTAPSQELDVVGDIELSNYLYFGNGSTEYLRWDGSDFILSDDFLPSSSASLNLGSDTYRWGDLYLDGATLHIGSSTASEGLISYASNRFNFETSSTAVDIAFFTDDLYIDKASGMVGIGTTNPLASLHIDKGMSHILIGNNDSGRTGLQIFLSSTASGYSVFQSVAASGTAYGDIAMNPFGGFVGIGTTSPTRTLHSAGTVRFSAYGAGTLITDASGNVSVSSDERLKDIQGSFDRGLEEILQLDPILYKWNETSGMETETVYAGLSAQNVQSVIPEAVGVSSDGYLTLSDRPILSATINAIKEQQLQIEELRDLLIGEGKILESTEFSESIPTTDTGILAEIQALYQEFKDMILALGMTSHTDELGNNYLSIDSDVKMAGDLNVLGDTTTSNLTVLGNIQAGTIEIDTAQNSINVLGVSCYNPETGETNQECVEMTDQTLYLQKTSSGNLDVFNGKLVIEPNGTMKLDGNLEVTGTVKSDTVEADTVIIKETKTPDLELGSQCKPGEMTWDQDYIYVCTTENMWSRSKLELIPGQSAVQPEPLLNPEEVLVTDEGDTIVSGDTSPSETLNP